MAVKVDSMSDLVSTMERRMQSLTEQSMKLERMILHFSHEQERCFEPVRQNQLRRMKSYHSEPNLNEHEEVELATINGRLGDDA